MQSLIKGILGEGSQILKSQSFTNSDQLIVASEGKAYIVKHLTTQKVSCYHSAEYLLPRIQAYYNSMRVSQVSVPECRYVIHDGHLFEISSLEGEDLEVLLIRLPDDEGIQLLSKVLQDLVIFLSQKEDIFPIGIDMRLNNFTKKPNQAEITFVDFMPPLLFYENSYLVNIPQPIDSEEYKSHLVRKFTLGGIIRRLFFSTIAIKPHWAKTFWFSLEGNLPAYLTKKIKAALEAIPTLLPEFDDWSINSKIEFLNSISESDVDALREFASRVLPFDPSKPDQRLRDMEQVFLLSSFCNTAVDFGYPAARDERLKILKVFLLKQLGM